MVENVRHHRLKTGARFFILALLLVALLWIAWLRPKSNALCVQARAAYEAAHFEESLTLANEAQRWNPLNSRAFALAGWSHLQLRDYPVAIKFFHKALWLDPLSSSAREGLGLSFVEAGDGVRALDYFRLLPNDVREGNSIRLAMARAYRMVGDNRDAVECLATILKGDPSNGPAEQELSFLTGFTKLPSTSIINSGPSTRPKDLMLAAQLKNGYFEVPKAGVWKQFYIAGVNIGPALPGHFATEAPTSTEVYLKWFGEIGAMGADTIRVYTLLPPAFYRALLSYDQAHPLQPLYLLQEIWFEDPPQSNFFNKGFTQDFTHAMEDVIDAAHGQANIPIRPGHAGGLYTADVSPYVLAWLVGREIEPHVVTITNQDNPGVHAFNGRYLKVAHGSPSEVWLAEMCNRAVDYDVSKYNTERPVAFVNWPPLDPLMHPSVAPFEEGRRMLEKLGFVFAPLPFGVPDTDDGVSLDEEHISSQPDDKAGYFALYHVYPFNPDFIFLDPAYQKATDKQGPDSYWGYLLALKQHYRNTPIVIGEYGLSTSLGTAHINPSGWNHGGLSEEEQAAGLVRMTDNIKDAGYAGGVVFEWMDEWWKHTWITTDFEKPFERKALWHNDLDPEQFFGLVKFVPPEPLSFVPIGTAEVQGEASGQTSLPEAPPQVTSIYASHDDSALYLNLFLDRSTERAVDWSKDRYVIALNTCDDPCGAQKLPVPGPVQIAEGANFAIELQGPDTSRLQIAREYNPWRKMAVGPHTKITEIGTPRNMRITLDPHGVFEDAVVETNRLRFAADGTMYPEVDADRSLLHYGDFKEGAPDYSSLGQWYYDQQLGVIRLRLSWGLLLALDPSEGFVFWGTDNTGEPMGKITHTIRIALVAYSASAPTGTVPSEIMAASVSGTRVTKCWTLPWPTWSSVNYQEALKKSYDALSSIFPGLTGYANGR